MKKANVSLQVIPIDAKDSYPIIDEAIKVIQGSGIRYEVTPFATVMEGDLDHLLKTVLEAKAAAFTAGADELLLNVQIHVRRDGNVSFEEKTSKFQ